MQHSPCGPIDRCKFGTRTTGHEIAHIVYQCPYQSIRLGWITVPAVFDLTVKNSRDESAPSDTYSKQPSLFLPLVA